MLIALFAVIRIVTLRAVEGRCCHDNCDITLNETTQCLEGCRVQASRQAATRRTLSNVRSKGNETAFIRHRNRVQQVRPLLLVRRLVPLQDTSCRCRRPRCCCNHSHRETRKCVWKYVPRTQTLSSPEKAIVQPRHHFSTERQPTSLVTKNVLAEHCATTYVCGCLLEKLKRGGAQGGTSAQQEAQLDGSDACGTATTSTITHGGSTHKRKILKKTRRQGVAVCVALRVSARPGRKETKQEGKKCVLRPTGPRRTPTRHGSLSAPFVAAPPHACSRRGAQGRRHERVGGCASGAVGREHTAPLTGRVQKKQLKEGRLEKKKERPY
ncbi:hypothetical protein ECC02_006851 [Trypanosoma cruzi]|uniref:Secreted protein n=1 Tax=Trypanosoma cruzi TaxID=5693 RepID=A0A7J6Y135_TRYCR|nr:hypothetical protein ECC02_006851 [Trypanosoma cruzi]